MKLFYILKSKSFDAVKVIAVLSFSLCVITLLADVLTGREMMCKSIVSVLMSVQVFNLLLSSLCERRVSRMCCKVLLAVQLMAFIESFLIISGHEGVEWTKWLGLMAGLLIVLALVLFFSGIWSKVANIRLLAKDGTVWGTMQICVEALYIVVYVSLGFVGTIGWLIGGLTGRIIMLTAFLLLLLQLAALAVRVYRDCLLVFKSEHENTVLESLKVSRIEISCGPKPEAYRDLYDRILDYFERDKPFLSSKLTVADVARVVFSNKSYISRVISIFTGRNFCQFVNYYRITYAMGLFRSNPNLKVTQLSAMSGFNSVVSFNMAFRLFMDENPSDWCRKEQRKALKKKK